MKLKSLSCAVLLLWLLVPQGLLASISGNAQFDVRTSGGGGNDSNGGCFDPSVGSPGTNQSTGAGTAITITLTGANTGTGSPAITSTTNGPGNCVQITGGSGCTTGVYEINSQSGGTATFDRNMGSSSDTCTGTLGGSFLTIGAVATAITNYSATGAGPVWVWGNGGASTYANSSVITLPCMSIVGYNSTQGDLGNGTQPWSTIVANAPLITMTAASTQLFRVPCSGQETIFQNLRIQNTNGTPSGGIVSYSNSSRLIVDSVQLNGFSRCIDGADDSQSDSFAALYVRYSEIENCTDFAVGNNGGGVTVSRSYIHGNTNGASGEIGLVYQEAGVASFVLTNNIIVNNSGSVVSGAASVQYFFRNNIIAFNTNGDALDTSISNIGTFDVANNIIYDNGGWGINCGGTTLVDYGNVSVLNNAFGSNGSGAVQGCPNHGTVSLTVNPFVNSGSGNYELNGTAGGGAALKAAGIPGSIPGLSSTVGYLDINAVQSQSSSGGGATPYAY